MLIEQAKRAAEAVRAADKAAVEGRREANLAYGKAIRALRQRESNKKRFNALLKEHGLELGTPGFRSDAMWMAENWADLQLTVSHCSSAHPTNIRSWWRERLGGGLVA